MRGAMRQTHTTTQEREAHTTQPRLGQDLPSKEKCCPPKERRKEDQRKPKLSGGNFPSCNNVGSRAQRGYKGERFRKWGRRCG